MLNDIWTVAYKEFKEIWAAMGNRSALLRMGIWLVIFGVMFPLQSPENWLISLTPVLLWSWMGMYYVGALAVNAFAGERERHTLETLLATRLPDRAILFGKIAANALYGWALVLASAIIGLVAINVFEGGSPLRFYTPAVGLGGLLLSLLVTLAVAIVAVLISLLVSTTRQGQMILYVISVLLFLPLVFGLEATEMTGLTGFLTGDPAPVVPLAIAATALLGAVLLAIAMGRFRRSELILD